MKAAHALSTFLGYPAGDKSRKGLRSTARQPEWDLSYGRIGDLKRRRSDLK
jgi:hypothetical protein